MKDKRCQQYRLTLWWLSDQSHLFSSTVKCTSVHPKQSKTIWLESIHRPQRHKSLKTNTQYSRSWSLYFETRKVAFAAHVACMTVYKRFLLLWNPSRRKQPFRLERAWHPNAIKQHLIMSTKWPKVGFNTKSGKFSFQPALRPDLFASD